LRPERGKKRKGLTITHRGIEAGEDEGQSRYKGRSEILSRNKLRSKE